MTQLSLANLVDLALGEPDNLNHDNFSLLHASLRIILKKLNLSDAKVELCDDLAEKTQSRLLKDIAVCYNEVVEVC